MGRITVNNFSLPVHPLHILEIVVISISNISSKTVNADVHSACVSYGPLERLIRKKGDAVDALFSVKNRSAAGSILKKLNKTTMDDRKQSAHLQAKNPHHPQTHTPTTTTTTPPPPGKIQRRLRSMAIGIKGRQSVRGLEEATFSDAGACRRPGAFLSYLTAPPTSTCLHSPAIMLLTVFSSLHH